MLNNLNFININSQLSKSVLDSIINKKKIEFKKLKILNLKKKIDLINIEYLKKIKQNNFKNDHKYQIFWELIKKKFKGSNIIFKKRNQKEKEKKVHVLFSDFNKALGFTPSLLFLLIYSEKIREYIQANELYKKIKKTIDAEEINNEEKILFFNLLLKKKITLITPLCPDYEHIKIANGFYKYTFNKLNGGLGLIGKRFISIMHKLHDALDKHGIKFKHYLLYGDFESYSESICKRLDVSEKSFIFKLQESTKKMKKSVNKKSIVGLIVKNLSNKKDWIKRCDLNEKKMYEKIKKDSRFNRLINEITNSRSMLYSSWFPDQGQEDYKKLVIKQGAEYLTMADLFNKNFKNPLIIGLDHPKMKKFYNLNSKIAVIYGKPRYI